MKWTLLLLLSATTSASTSVLSSAPQWESDLPDSRFRVDLMFDAPFLPVNPTLVNIMHFMSIVSRGELDEQVQPRTYSDFMYRQVQVTTYEWTEARFLLWGIYLAARDMIRFTRFHNSVVKLYWDNSLVGQITLTVKTGLSLLNSTRNGTRSIMDYGGEPSLVGSGYRTTEAVVERLTALPVQNMSDVDTVGKNPAFSSKMENTALSIPFTSPTIVAPNALLLPRLSIDFDRVIGSVHLGRNDVFFTFYTALLHVAKFPAENQMQAFNSKPPMMTLQVHMYESGIGCLVNSSALACVI